MKIGRRSVSKKGSGAFGEGARQNPAQSLFLPFGSWVQEFLPLRCFLATNVHLLAYSVYSLFGWKRKEKGYNIIKKPRMLKDEWKRLFPYRSSVPEPWNYENYRTLELLRTGFLTGTEPSTVHVLCLWRYKTRQPFSQNTGRNPRASAFG